MEYGSTRHGWGGLDSVAGGAETVDLTLWPQSAFACMSIVPRSTPLLLIGANTGQEEPDKPNDLRG